MNSPDEREVRRRRGRKRIYVLQGGVGRGRVSQKFKSVSEAEEGVPPMYAILDFKTALKTGSCASTLLLFGLA